MENQNKAGIKCETEDQDEIGFKCEIESQYLQENPDKMEKETEEPSLKRSTRIQLSIALMTFMSSIAPSMSLGFSAIALPPLLDEENPYKVTQDEASWIASIASISAPLGCLVAGPLSDKFGRTKAILLVSAVSALGWSIITTSYHTSSQQYPIMLIGRFFTGVSTGLASMPATTYVAEISSTKLRPVMTTSSFNFFATGILLVYVLGYFFQENWGAVAMISTAISCISFFLGMVFVPESPSWLVSKNRLDRAKTNMTKIYGFKETNSLIDGDFKTLLNNKTQKKQLRLEDFLAPTFWKPFLIMVTYFFFTQSCGTLTLVFYAIDIVKEAGITVNPYYIIIIIGIVRLISSITSSSISGRLGRRPLSLISASVTLLALLALGSIVLAKEKGTISSMESFQIVQIMFLLIYFFFSSLGILTLPFAMNPEMFPTKIRGTASGLACSLNYVFNFGGVKLYPAAVAIMGNYGVFYFFASMSFLAIVFIFFFLPETRGKTLAEIEEYFKGSKC